jgi:hypothetical protein
MADEMKTENRTSAYTKVVGLFVPVDDLATATAGDPETVASNLNSGRGSGQLTSAKLVESFGDTRPVHRTSVGNVGVSDDLPSGTCRETYMPPRRRLLRKRSSLELPRRKARAMDVELVEVTASGQRRTQSRTPSHSCRLKPQTAQGASTPGPPHTRSGPRAGSFPCCTTARAFARRLSCSSSGIWLTPSENAEGQSQMPKGRDVTCVNQAGPVEGEHQYIPAAGCAPRRRCVVRWSRGCGDGVLGVAHERRSRDSRDPHHGRSRPGVLALLEQEFAT